jgi:hypothetical protein
MLAQHAFSTHAKVKVLGPSIGREGYEQWQQKFQLWSAAQVENVLRIWERIEEELQHHMQRRQAKLSKVKQAG